MNGLELPSKIYKNSQTTSALIPVSIETVRLFYIRVEAIAFVNKSQPMRKQLSIQYILSFIEGGPSHR